MIDSSARKSINGGVIVNIANTANPNEVKPFSLQAEVIRRIQIKDGQTPCYATPTGDRCDNKDCGWRHDCFDEARERGE